MIDSENLWGPAKIDWYKLAPVEAGMGRKDLKNIEGNGLKALGQFRLRASWDSSD
jgi:hypothetical protein